MPSQGPLGCGTGADDAAVGTVSWSSPGNITADDGAYASAISLPGATTHYLKATNFGFSIVSGATILGLVVEWKRSASTGTVTDSRIRVIKGGVIGATERSAGATWSGADTFDLFGSSVDLWGDAWTDTDVNASNFGFALSAVLSGTSTGRVDYVRATVYYSSSSFDPATNSFGFVRSQARVLEVRHTNRSRVSAGVLEMTLVNEPTQAAFVSARGVTPPPVRASGAIAARPVPVPPDQAPPFGWFEVKRGRNQRADPPAANRSTYSLPLERTPPFPDSWLTVRKPGQLRTPRPGQSTIAFVGPQTGPTFRLTMLGRGRVMPVRPAQVRTFLPFADALGAAFVRARGGRGVPPTARTIFRYVQPPDIATVPSVVMGRRTRFPARGSVRIVAPGQLLAEGEAVGSLVIQGRSARPPAFPRVASYTRILEPTSTGILTLGFLRPLVCRPVVTWGVAANATRIAWTPLTIATVSRIDNRNALGRGGRNITGTGLGSRNQTGIGNT